uniref:ATP synthase F0 subunit 8 n=1 Tax=Scutiphora pedicellata TaxID=2080403 RepID=A0A2P1CLU1_9HEMI|nr:ATP synthase F0 subunit 8 [Scutiphora pedicellata]
MPQMAPLYWEILFIMFIMSMMMFMMMIFHLNQNKTLPEKMNKKITNQINWKW